MKNNFRPIFSRLIGATVIVGIAAFIITTVFKLLIGLVLIGGVVNLIKKAKGNRNHQFGNPEQYGQISGNQFGAYSQPQWTGAVSANSNPVQSLTIVPIN